MMSEATAEILVRTYCVILSKRGAVESALTALFARAVRKGISVAFTWTWGAVTVDGRNSDTPGTVRIALEIKGSAPRIAGWHFVASLDHMTDDTGSPISIVRGVPGEHVPPKYRTANPDCDHCKFNRRRGSTFVLAHVDGTHMQVGSTCITDFLGPDGFKAAALAQFLSEVGDIGDEGASGQALDDGSYALSVLMPAVAACIRVHGWVSRTYAREHSCLATADCVLALLSYRWKIAAYGERPEVTDIDTARAEAAIVWAKDLSDADIQASTGDYLHNVRTIARAGYVTSRTLGIGASILSAFDRALGREIERKRATESQHFGTVGKRDTFTLTLTRQSSYETQYGMTHIYIFTDSVGNTAVWKASSHQDIDVGSTYKVTGTVKEHGDYKGAKQTSLTRCKIGQLVQAA